MSDIAFTPVCPADRGPWTKRDFLRLLNGAAGHHFDVSSQRVGGRDKAIEACEARYICWHVLSACNGWSNERIGRAYNRDSTTVSHGLRRHDDLCDDRPAYQVASNAVRKFWEKLDV